MAEETCRLLINLMYYVSHKSNYIYETLLALHVESHVKRFILTKTFQAYLLYLTQTLQTYTSNLK